MASLKVKRATVLVSKTVGDTILLTLPDSPTPKLSDEGCVCADTIEDLDEFLASWDEATCARCAAASVSPQQWFDLGCWRKCPEQVKTWKARTTTKGAVLTINGREFEVGTSGSAIAFDLERAAGGWNPPEDERRV